MKYKLLFEYDSKEKTARYVLGNIAVAQRNIETYEQLAEFTSKVVNKFVIIPRLKQSERVDKVETSNNKTV